MIDERSEIMQNYNSVCEIIVQNTFIILVLMKELIRTTILPWAIMAYDHYVLRGEICL